MTKLCYAFFKYENKLKHLLRKVIHSFEVHSNESACRKKVRLGLEQVFSNKPKLLIKSDDPPTKHNHLVLFLSKVIYAVMS